MAITEILPGYMGILTIDGTKQRCDSFAVNVNQDILAYTHVLGLNDVDPGTFTTKTELPGAIQIQKTLLRPSVIGFTGSFSFPATYDGLLETLFNRAKDGDYFDVEFSYAPEIGGRKYTSCRINSLSLSITAGEFLNVDAEVWALEYEDTDGGDTFIDPQKLITWDVFSVESGKVRVGGDGNPHYSSFDMSINNNLLYIYTSGGGGEDFRLYPSDLRVGMQEVTGNVGIWMLPGEVWEDGAKGNIVFDTLEIDIGGDCEDILDVDANIAWKRRMLEGTVGPFMTSLEFTGVDRAFGV